MLIIKLGILKPFLIMIDVVHNKYKALPENTNISFTKCYIVYIKDFKFKHSISINDLEQ